MAEGKWIKDLTPDMKAADAARHVLEARYQVIRDHLPLAVREADRDPEHVHQLRVGTRRAGAALRIFASTLPEKAQRRARRHLRGMRRAAGAARDWDVFQIELLARKQQAEAKERPGLDLLLGYASGQRAAAQEKLVSVGEHHITRLRERVEGLLEAVRDPDDAPELTLETLGRGILRELVHDLEWAAHGDLDDYEHLHQVRILGKQLRYAIEVFIDCFPPSLKDVVYPAIEEMQEILGLANDSHVAGLRLSGLRDRLRLTMPADWKRYQPAVEQLLRFHQRRLPRERQRFVKWWTQWSATAGAALADILRSPADPATAGHRD